MSAAIQLRGQYAKARGLAQERAFGEMCHKVAQATEASQIFALLRGLYNKNDRAGEAWDIEVEDETHVSDPQKVADRFRRHMAPICKELKPHEVPPQLQRIRDDVDVLRGYSDADWRRWRASNPAVLVWGDDAEWEKAMNGKFTIKEIGGIVGKLKDGKTTNSALERNEMVKAMWPSQAFQERMCEMLNARLDGGDADPAWADIVQQMAHKTGNDATKTTNYRALSFMSVLAQVEAKLVMARVSALQEKYHMLDDNQNGCRETRGCMHNLVLMVIAMELNPHLYLAMLDVHKAHPTADRDACAWEMALMGFGGKLWRLLERLQEGKHCRVRCGTVFRRSAGCWRDMGPAAGCT
jgi:hypothetical protein